jgi:prenyltransferase beta subunit
MRQMKLEGGFQGRTCKLVDACYSFWQGAVFPILQTVLAAQSVVDTSSGAVTLMHRGPLRYLKNWSLMHV